MGQMETRILSTDPVGLTKAVGIWRGGGLVAFPTETVYGLGADARNGLAVASIFAAKGRPEFNPLIIHVADLVTAQKFAIFNETALALAEAFWPGPLSLVLPIAKDSGLSSLVSAGLDTVAVRVPAHPVAQSLLQAFGGAIAAPSANISGQISPTTAAHVVHGLNGVIDAIVDGGDCQVGLESTIVMPMSDQAYLLRPGGLPVEALQAALGQPLAQQQDGDKPLSPGQLAFHYAPMSELRLNQRAAPEQGLWLGFGRDCKGADLNLSASGDLTEAATNLFAYLRKLDSISGTMPNPLIVVAPVPDHGLGRAINDRLQRAAAPRN